MIDRGMDWRLSRSVSTQISFEINSDIISCGNAPLIETCPPKGHGKKKKRKKRISDKYVIFNYGSVD